MIIYNVTVSIDPKIESDWLEWMRRDHIPAVMQTGCFIKNCLSKIQGQEPSECSFSIMYWLESMDIYDRYQANFAPKLQQEHNQKFQGNFAAFRTLLEVIDEF